MYHRISNSLGVVLTMLVMAAVCRQASAMDILVSGRVFGKDIATGKPLPAVFAVIREMDGNSVAVVDAQGEFTISITTPLPARLVVAYVGYVTDTVTVNDDRSLEIRLTPSKELEEVEIVGKRSATEYSMLKPMNTETSGQKEILKAACCNLSEAFESSPTVNVAYTDAVTGAKEIRLLGLSGIYSQLLTEAIPNFRGIASSYGLYFIPGPWMESIQVTKGSGSVQQGYEATTGQINVEFHKPDNEKLPRFYLNLFGEQNGNMELNFHARKQVSSRWSTVLMGHGNLMEGNQDQQKDGFLDIPHARQLNFYNRWQHHNGRRLESQLGWRLIHDERQGGQTGFTLMPGQVPYHTNVLNRRAEIFGKLGIIFPERPSLSIGNIVQFTAHDLDATFGIRGYDAQQRTLFMQSILQNTFRSADHGYKVGINYRRDRWDEMADSSLRTVDESVPGIFAEYTYNRTDRFSMVAGGRADLHNIYGWIWTPRLHLRYSFTPDLLIRLSAGNSFRVPNLYADNISVFASSRRLVVGDSIRPERAWNFGANATWKFRLKEREGSVNLDAYRTVFVDQLVVDRVTAVNEVSFYNLNGSSFANSFQVAVDHELLPRLDVRLAAKMEDVKVTYNNSLQRKPLVPRDRFLLNLAWNSRNEHWRVDYTVVREGSKRLIPTFYDPEIGEEAAVSPVFYTMNLQLTKVFRRFELYGGSENVLNYIQQHPIVNAKDPFGTEFDATNVWAPLDGRRIYLGVRWSVR
jgi:outer membrane receptor for ferrienterochelin and colicin